MNYAAIVKPEPPPLVQPVQNNRDTLVTNDYNQIVSFVKQHRVQDYSIKAASTSHNVRDIILDYNGEYLSDVYYTLREHYGDLGFLSRRVDYNRFIDIFIKNMALRENDSMDSDDETGHDMDE